MTSTTNSVGTARRRRHPRRAAPIALATGAPALAVAAVAVIAVAGGQLVSSHVVVDVVVGSISAMLGGYLVARVPDNPMGWLFALSGTAYGATAAVSAWVTAAQVWGWPGLAVAAWVSEWAYVFALGPQLTFLLLLFPDGAPPTPRWRAVGWVSGATIIALVLVSAFEPRVHIGRDALIDNPFGGSAAVAQAAGPLLLLLGICGLVSFASLVVRLRRADERRRIAPYVVAATLVVAALVATPPGSAAEPYVQTAILPLLPIAATLCVLRYRLYDLEVAVRRSLVWLGLTVVVIGGYVLVVTAVSNLLHRQAGVPGSLIAAGAVAVVFQPSRSWLQRAVGRALYGDRDDPDRALADLGRTLEVTADPTAALDRAADRIAASLAVPWVAIEVDRLADPASEGPNGVHVAVSGRPPSWATDATTVSVSLSHAGTRYGTLSLSRRSPAEPLSSRDHELLERLAYPIAATAAAFRLTDDLRRSRERLVVAREEERRRLRHDLHDELGPLLAAVVVQLDAATLRARRTSSAGDPLLEELRSTAQDAIATLRRAVEDLRPPALDELGLVGALRATTATFAAATGPALAVRAPDALPPLPAAVEVAAYRIAVEAMTNAVRHAGAGNIATHLSMRGDALVVTVQDDGRGLPSELTSGIGTISMRDRAEELGGTWHIGRRPDGGTEVRAHLPIGAI